MTTGFCILADNIYLLAAATFAFCFHYIPYKKRVEGDRLKRIFGDRYEDYDQKVPLIIMNDNVRGVFSFAKAISQAMERKAMLKDGRSADNSAWIIALEPIRIITDKIYEEYIAYRNMLISA